MNKDTTAARQTKEEITQFIQGFENGFDPARPQLSKIPVTILGYGEISSVIAFDQQGYDHLAFKRLPLFASESEARDYCELYLEYNDRLTALGIETPKSEAFYVKGHHGLYVAYLGQEKLNKESIGNKILHALPDAALMTLFELVIQKMIHLWQHNQKHPDFLLGLDSQISNWAIKNFNSAVAISKNTALLYIDTSTPMMRKQGKEQMNPLLFLQSAPKPMRWILKKFFLQEVMDRYYDFRLVTIDLLANLYKEQRQDLIPDLIEMINGKGAEFLGGNPLTLKEINSYYREDKFIWKLFLAMRRTDRFIQSGLLGKRYEFTLPGEIRR